MRAARLIKMVLLLQQRHAMTAAQLAVELEVSERTITRDVSALSEAGVPVYADRGRSGGYRLLGGYQTRLTGMGREEAKALFLSGVPEAVRDMGWADSASAAALKVSAALSPALRDAQHHVAGRFHLDAPAWWRQTQTPPLLPLLAEAVWEERGVSIRYRRGRRLAPERTGATAPESQSTAQADPSVRPDPADRTQAAHEEVVRELEPYGLVLKAGVWYLVARPAHAGVGLEKGLPEHRIYRVERITELTVGQERFVREEGFDLPAFWARQSAAFARSVLRESVLLRLSEVGARQLPYVHGVREVVREALSAGVWEEGGWRVTLPVETLEVAYQQLLGLGPEVEVLAPASLRARLARAAERTAALYARARPEGPQR